jgi:hypothetical protein
MVITLNSDDLPDWIDEPLLGIDLMFDEMAYREMEFAMKEVIKASDNRISRTKGYTTRLPVTNCRSPVAGDWQRGNYFKLKSMESTGENSNRKRCRELFMVHRVPEKLQHWYRLLSSRFRKRNKFWCALPAMLR